MLIVTDAGYGKRTQLDRFNRQGRGGQGVRGIKLTAKKGFVVAAFMVGIDDEIFVISSAGTLIRMAVRDDLVAGPRRHRRAGHEPRRRPEPWPPSHRSSPPTTDVGLTASPGRASPQPPASPPRRVLTSPIDAQVTRAPRARGR